jgi:hypothetical protein
VARMKAQWDEDCGSILLGDNTGGGAVMLRGIWFHCVEVWITSEAVLCICMLQLIIYILSSNWRKIRLAPHLSERKSGVLCRFVFD